MAAKQRDHIERFESSESRMTFTEFMRRFPTNDACLEYLKERFYPAGTECPNPKCRKASKFHRIKGRSAYSCQYCGHHVYPTAGTIFHKSTTSLQLWFWAIYLMSSTRCGLAAKHLEREIGVRYKTAHRMFKQIRTLLDDGGSLSGRVEIDETYMGGRRKGSPAGGRPGPNDSTKPPVLAMAERQGKIKARVVPNVRRASLQPEIRRFVLPSSIIYTDELKSYDLVGREYRRHYRIAHSQGIYIDGHVHVNTVESFFGLVKNGIKGSYRGVSTRYLQYYLDEYAWRWNHKYDGRSMFQTILDQVEKGRLPLPAAP